jgi:hypothetical protein
VSEMERDGEREEVEKGERGGNGGEDGIRNE